MKEEEIIKLIKSKYVALEENLLLTPEVTEIKDKIEQFLDEHIKGDSLLALRYRKFKTPGKPRTLWSTTNNYPIGGFEWIKPWFDFFEKYIVEKKIVNRLEDENLWVESRTQGQEQHLFIGSKESDAGEKVQLVFGQTGEIRIDKKDQVPSELLKKVESVVTTRGGKVMRTTMEFFDQEI